MKENEKRCCACSKRKKERSGDEYKLLMNRLNRIEGQIKGVKSMLENDAYCPDILIQVSAINAALNSFNKMLLTNHIESCVIDDIKADREGTVEELVSVLQKLMR